MVFSTINIINTQDRKKLGLKIGAYTLVSADLKQLKQKHRSQYDLAKEIEKLPGVRRGAHCYWSF
jgi:hypothetical protein